MGLRGGGVAGEGRERVMRCRVAVAAVALIGCGTITEQRETLREVHARAAYRRPTRTLLRADARLQGDILRVRAVRERRCVTGETVRGVRRTTVTRTWEGSGGLGGLAAVGVLGGGGVGFVAGVTGGPRSGADEALVAGAAVGGALLMVPWLVRVIQARDSVEEAPFTEDERSGEVVCESAPVAGARLTLRLGRRFELHQELDAQGEADLDLAVSIGDEGWRSAGTDAMAELRVGEGVGTMADLSSVRRRHVDRRWQSAVRSVEGLRGFARDFPEDPRAGEVPARAVALQRAADVAARRAAWEALGEDDVEAQSRFVAESSGDVFGVEVACRLASRASGLEPLRAAEQRCAVGVGAVSSREWSRWPDVAQRVEADRAEAERRRVEAEISAYEAQAAAEQSERERRDRARARAAATWRSVQARVAAAVAACGAGRTGAASARGAYEALRSIRGSRQTSLAHRVAAACRCTPTQAGVPLQ